VRVGFCMGVLVVVLVVFVKISGCSE